MRHALNLAKIIMTVLSLCLLGEAKSVAQTEDGTRFLTSLAQLAEGDSRVRTIEVLGFPTAIQSKSELIHRRDALWLDALGIDEVLCYGECAPGYPPTLGQVFMSRGAVAMIVGIRSSGWSATSIDKSELSRLLRLLDDLPAVDGFEFDPSRIIRAVNALHSLGEESARSVIQEYFRITPRCDFKSRESVYLMLRVLYDPPNESKCFPVLALGSPHPYFESKESIQRFPLVIANDIPLLVIDGYSRYGLLPDADEVLQWYAEHCEMRKRPLAPQFDAVHMLMKVENECISLLENKGHAERMRGIVIRQMAIAVKQDRIVSRRWSSADNWRAIAATMPKETIEWNIERQEFIEIAASATPPEQLPSATPDAAMSCVSMQ